MVEDLIFTATIRATPDQVYRAFTNGAQLRSWMCDNSYVQDHVGGSFLMAWNLGYHASGQFTQLEPARLIGFTWQGNNEAGQTQVRVELTPSDELTTIELVHSGLGEGEEWERTARDLTSGWDKGLEDLKYVLETGLDARLMRRPMLGIAPERLTPETAQKLGVPIQDGVLLAGVVDGMGAADAGLQANDVLVQVNGQEVKDWPSMQKALGRAKAGDTVEIELYRGSQRHSATMTLSQRPAPEVPTSPQALAGKVDSINAELIAEMDAIVGGLPEEILAQRPSLNVWSVNENIAHLIWAERWLHQWVWSTAGGEDNLTWPDNGPLQRAGILAVYPTSADLVQEYKRSKAETCAQVSALGETLAVDNPYIYMQIGQYVINNASHDQQHFAQMRESIAALESSRQG